MPRPLEGQIFDTRQLSDDDAKLVIQLYDEARKALSQLAPSCAVLMCRKILMHLAVEHGAMRGEGFKYYAEFLKSSGIVGKPQHILLDRIKKAGNDENHKIRKADEIEATELLRLVTLLIESVYYCG